MSFTTSWRSDGASSATSMSGDPYHIASAPVRCSLAVAGSRSTRARARWTMRSNSRASTWDESTSIRYPGGRPWSSSSSRFTALRRLAT